jgi:hypothetical protein
MSPTHHNRYRARNQRTINEVQKLHADSKMKPREWEQVVGMLLTCNGWQWWHDKDRSTKEENQKRKRGFPDFIVRKWFASAHEMPEILLNATGLWHYLRREDSRLYVVGFIECKTGTGRVSEDQGKWLEAGRWCPGGFGIAVWPSDRQQLVSLLGGNEIVR